MEPIISQIYSNILHAEQKEIIRNIDAAITQGLSALITSTMPVMRSAIELLEKSGLRQYVKVIVGGAPVTEEYTRQIGADLYASDASRAVTIAKYLLKIDTS